MRAEGPPTPDWPTALSEPEWRRAPSPALGGPPNGGPGRRDAASVV